MPITLPELPYAYDALEPVISSSTLKLHHGAHHRGYIDKLNALLKGSSDEGKTLQALIEANAGAAANDARARAIYNNAAQACNHAFYWRSLRPKGSGRGPGGALAEKLAMEFGGLQDFIDQFKAAALGVFGSGWAWLVLDGGALRIACTANADTPIARGRIPLLVVDVWEHAYYLDYQSRRAEYLSGVVDHLLDWSFAERNFLQAEAAHV
jgi:Fe-Mn family superoxide dismutase